MPVFSVAGSLQEFLPHLVKEFCSEDHLNALGMRYLLILICINELAIDKEIDDQPELVGVMFCEVCNVGSRMSANGSIIVLPISFFDITMV